MDNGDTAALGTEMHALVRELYPICRSITGDGVRETLRIIGRHVPVVVEEVPTGTQVLDWTVPREWNIRDAWIKDGQGRKVVDFLASNLHVVSYSVPVRERLRLKDLKPHLHSLPDQPDWIPYRTTYYREGWGFCLSHRQLASLPDDDYEVCIDSTLEPGHLTYGEFVLPGETEDEILLSTHVCHPSLCDDNLSAIAVSTFLARHLAAGQARRRHTLRFLYAPGTIGSITWLARNRERAARIKYGLTLVCLGDNRPFTYKRTLEGTSGIDRVVEHVLRHANEGNEVIDFFPYGYDERQFNSPGFRLPVGSLMRGRHGRFPEYHTSADNPDFVSASRLAESWRVILDVLDVLDGDRSYRNLCPLGEPQLGARGLYRATGGSDIPGLELAMLWVLSLSDGSRSLLSIAERAGIRFEVVRKASELLERHELVADAGA
jgi:aminopeptidase-like protein